MDGGLRHSTEKTLIELNDTQINDIEIVATLEIDSTLYAFSLKKISLDSNEYQLPSSLTPSQTRKTARIEIQEISSKPIVLELKGHLWRAYGQAKDGNASFISATISYSGSEPKEGDVVALRAFNSSGQTISTTASLKKLLPIKGKDLQVLLDCYGPKQTTEIPRASREKPALLTFLEIFWPDQEGLKIRVEVTEANSTGFSAKISESQREMPPKGALCKIGSSDITARFQWHSGDRIGFDLSVNPRKELAIWNDWLEEWHLRTLNRTPITKKQARIASILMRSGYLKESKSDAFARTAGLTSLIPSNGETKTWIKRFVRGGESGIDSHVSYVKCTDTSWMIQELGNASITQRVGNNLLNESLESFVGQESPYITFGSTLIALFDPTSKFNQDYWLKRETTPELVSYEGRLVDLNIASKIILNEKQIEESNLFIKSPTLSSWGEDWRSLIAWSDERTLFGLGIRPDDFSASELKQTLSKSGYITDRRVELITENGTVVGVSVFFGVPTFSNLNFTSSHLWLLVEDPSNWKPALKALLNKHGVSPFEGILESVLLSPNMKSTDLSFAGLDPDFCARRKLYFVPIYKLRDFIKNEGEEQVA